MNGIVGLKPTRGLVSTGRGGAGLPLAGLRQRVHPRRRGRRRACSRSSPDRIPTTRGRAPGAHPSTSRPGPPARAWPTGTRLRGRHRDGRRVRARSPARRRRPRRRRPCTSPWRRWSRRATCSTTGPWVAERLAGLEGFLADHPDDVLPVTRAVIERGREFDRRRRLPRPPPAAGAARGVRPGLAGRRRAAAPDRAHDVHPRPARRGAGGAQPRARPYTQFANLLDLAAVAVPAGTTADGRPVGVTLLGPAFAEARLFAAAQS